MTFRTLTIFATAVSSLWAGVSSAQDPVNTPATVTVTVPVNISDITSTVYGIRVECNLASYLGTVVASGSTYLIVPAIYETKLFEIGMGTELTDDMMPLEIEGLDAKVIVTVTEKDGRHIDSWMLGYCKLHILHDISESGSGKIDIPTLCNPAPEDDDTAFCAWPDTVPVGYVEFNRAGLTPDATATALPGVD